MKKFLLPIAIHLLAVYSVPAQEAAVRGRVTDARDGLPLAGVVVSVEGTEVGTATDAGGNYTINAADGQTLVFDYMGYGRQRIAVAGRRTVDAALVPEDNVIDPLVVIGYGAVKKSDLTGAVASIRADRLQGTPAATLDQALQGRAAGVTVNAASGQPGQQAEVRIRGIGSVFGKQEPLYVVDGVIVSDITFLSPNDIASTEILKDASSAAIYGSRAANGVVLITTRSGAAGERARITYDMYAGIQSRWKKLDLLGRDEHMETMLSLIGTPSEIDLYRNEGLNGWLYAYRIRNSSYFPVIRSAANPGGFDYASQETDWQDEVFRRNALIHNHHIGVSGGSERNTYAASVNYFSQNGTIRGSDYQRLTARLNTAFQLIKWLKLGENFSFSSSSSRRAMNNNSSPGASILSAALAMAPWDPPRYPAGAYNAAGADLGGRIAAASNNTNVTNPLTMIDHIHPVNNTERLVGVVFLEITPVGGLTLRSDVSIDLSNAREREFKDKYDYSGYDRMEFNYLSSSMARYHTITFDNIATYARRIGKHEFSVMAGHTVSEYNYYRLTGSGTDIANPVPSNWYLSKTTQNKTVSDAVERSRMMSLLGRVHYSFGGRYLLTFNFRADGSDRFPENVWGYFPSLAAAWRVTGEPWMENVRVLSNLKLRVGWGRLGNDDIGQNRFTQVMFDEGPTFVGYPLGMGSGDVQTIQTGAAVLTYINRGGRWETTEHWNAGLDFSLWRNRLSGSVDFFVRDTKDVLLVINTPGHVGNRHPPMGNAGTVRNRGVEFTLEHTNSVETPHGPFDYSVSANMSFIRNRLVMLNGGDRVWGDRSVSDEGIPLFSFWGYEYLGIYRSQDEIDAYLPEQGKATAFRPGDAKYRDRNGDGKLDDLSDMTVIGNPFPRFTYGFNISLGWFGFDMQLFWQGVHGNQIYNAVRERTENTGVVSRLSASMRDVWTTDNPGGSIPDPSHSVNFFNSSRFVEDGSYLRLKSLQLGYTLPAGVSRKFGASRFRIYAAANNLFTFTKYSGYDPEVGGGVDYGNYPQSRTWMLGANISF